MAYISVAPDSFWTDDPFWTDLCKSLENARSNL